MSDSNEINEVISSVDIPNPKKNGSSLTLSYTDQVLLYVLLELRKLNANFEKAFPQVGGKKTTKRVSSARKTKEVK